MKKNWLLLFFLSFLFVPSASAQDSNLASRPLQLTLHIPVLFSFPGYGVGYQFNNTFYLGFDYQQGKRLGELKDDDKEVKEDYGQDGLDDYHRTIGALGTIELRISKLVLIDPFFLSVGVIGSEGTLDKIELDRRERLIGSNTYLTHLKIRLELEQQISPGIGFGFTTVGKETGATVSFGIFGGTNPRKKPEVTIEQRSGDEVISPADLYAFERLILSKLSSQTPLKVYLSIGYSF